MKLNQLTCIHQTINLDEYIEFRDDVNMDTYYSDEVDMNAGTYNISRNGFTEEGYTCEG